MADEQRVDEQETERETEQGTPRGTDRPRPKVMRVLAVPPGDEFVPGVPPAARESPEVREDAPRTSAPLEVRESDVRAHEPLEVREDAPRTAGPLDVRTSDGPAGTQPAAEGRAMPSSVVDCGLYLDGVRQPGALHYAEAFEAARQSGNGFVWLGIHEPTEEDFAEIAETFGLHPLAVEDTVKAHQRPKLERYSDMTFVVLKTARYCEHAELTVTSEVVETGDVMLFIGAEYVLSVRHGDACRLTGVRAELETRTDLLRHGPWAVFHGVTDNIVDRYEEVVQAIEDDIDEVENGVFSRQATDVQRIYHLRRELLEFKRAVVPLGRPLEMLVSGQVPSVPLEIQRYIRDIADHQQRVTDSLASFEDLLTSILQADLAQIGIQQNNDMRKISSWVAIAAVPTMIAGIYGMNFEHMPELGWRYGYGLVLFLMAVVCGSLYRAFRRSGWL